MLVHSKAFPAINTPEMTQERARHEAGAACKIVVCVDDHEVSKRCFDLASRLVRSGDELDALHVDTDSTVAQMVYTKFNDMCGKLSATTGVSSHKIFNVPKKGGSIKNTIIDYCDEGTTLNGAPTPADVLVMGSIELADPKKDVYLGSVVAAVAKVSECNLLIVKHFA